MRTRGRTWTRAVFNMRSPMKSEFHLTVTAIWSSKTLWRPATLNVFIATMERLYAEGKYDPEGSSGRSEDPRRHVRTDYLGTDPIFMDLLVHPRTFPKVWGNLGWNINYYTGDLTISDQEDDGTYDPEGKSLKWHQDSGRSSLDMFENDVPARLSIKVGYFLTDLTEAGSGNLWIVPGSQLMRRKDLPPDGQGPPARCDAGPRKARDGSLFRPTTLAQRDKKLLADFPNVYHRRLRLPLD